MQNYKILTHCQINQQRLLNDPSGVVVITAGWNCLQLVQGRGFNSHLNHKIDDPLHISQLVIQKSSLVNLMTLAVINLQVMTSI